jgi:hypothetical protein
MSANPSDLTSRQTSPSGMRLSSGGSYGARCCSAMVRGMRWIAMPLRTRPALPRRCHRLAWDAHCRIAGGYGRVESSAAASQ